MPNSPQIGVLALQGAFDVHAKRLAELGATTRLVRKPEDLEDLDALVIPGGESTTFLKHLERAGFYDVLDTFVHTKPVFGTCAGCILLAKDVQNPPQRSFAALDITVERNAYGRQNDSVILQADTALPGGPMEMVFIRAPRITRLGPGIEPLAYRNGDPVLIRNGRILAATFHPELSEDRRVHQIFIDMVRGER
ncbi:MAG TPA: pyridoxal 5'-phosphate synthase glutaminase subunit PdxT [Acidobacteriaceae bacterium]|nr:pyridoxal 5'-phosphate synthase glutaminase subunit PdxT [Acidobacteriaceae bacterium]